jgi:hypothetical protein
MQARDCFILSMRRGFSWNWLYDLRTRKVVFWEVILILASVLIFRGAWMLLDMILRDDMMSLTIELVLGTIVATIAVYVINKSVK